MTRTQHTYDLQRALLQMQQSGILPVVKEPSSIYGKLKSSPSVTFMPEEWVRGAILVRCKSLLNGHSAIRWQLVVTLITLLNENLIPLVPLRGSISASGDLSPLSYIAGAMEGNPGIWVWSDGKDGERVPIPSHVALARVKLQPQRFGPKEGLAVLNGTAFSTSVAALALHEANQLALLSQVLTAMGVEALSGAVGSFDPFFAKVRPHKGQAEAARNILGFLKGSSLAHTAEQAGNDDTQLKQDRYTLRTASQWIGPQLEDLALAHEQISVECNSTTDNPLLDLDDETIHHVSTSLGRKALLNLLHRFRGTVVLVTLSQSAILIPISVIGGQLPGCISQFGHGEDTFVPPNVRTHALLAMHRAHQPRDKQRTATEPGSRRTIDLVHIQGNRH